MGQLVLVIDDDPEVGFLVKEVLKPININVCQALSGQDGLRKSYQLHPDLIILDVMMPDIDGFNVCLRLNEITNTPILMLTACAKESDLVHGFGAGADDFLKKPFSVKEFRARVQALLRRSNNHSINEIMNSTHYKDDVLLIDLDNKRVELEGKILKLSSIEYDVLASLASNMGKIVSHHEIMQVVWGSSYGNTQSILTFYIYALRKKLKNRKNDHQYIQTHWGRGYMFLPRKA
jgi:DNA-binding response OmpR family regulator